MKSSLLGMVAVLVVVAAWLLLRDDSQVAPAAAVSDSASSGESAPQPDSVPVPKHAGRRTDATPDTASRVPNEGPQLPAAMLGRVLDSAGRPVAGASVYAWPPETDDPQRRLEATSGDEGTFRLEVPPDTWHLGAHHAAHGRVVREALSMEAVDLDVGDLVLQPMPALSGRLVYADGQPIADYRVRIGPVGAAGASPAHIRNESVRTDRDGRIAVRNLDEGTYELLLNYMSFRDDEEPKLRLTTGQAEQQLVIDRHRVRVLGTDDLGITGWREGRAAELREAQRTGSGWHRLWDDADMSAAGQVEDSLVPRGSWWYVGNSAGRRWAEALLHADRSRNETTVELEMREVKLSGVLRVRLRAKDGSAPDAVEMRRVDAAALDSPDFYETMPRDGDDFLFRMAPGRFVIHMRVGPDRFGYDKFMQLQREVHIIDGRETLLEAVARQGGRVRMTVHLPGGETGRYLSRFKATTLDDAGQEVPVRPYQTQMPRGYVQGTPDSGTPFTCMKLLRPGRHEFTVTVKGYEPARVSAFIEIGKTVAVDVHLRK